MEAANQARAEAFAMPLDQIDVSKPRLFQDDSIGYCFKRLRRDEPTRVLSNLVHGCTDLPVRIPA